MKEVFETSTIVIDKIIEIIGIVTNFLINNKIFQILIGIIILSIILNIIFKIVKMMREKNKKHNVTSTIVTNNKKEYEIHSITDQEFDELYDDYMSNRYNY